MTRYEDLINRANILTLCAYECDNEEFKEMFMNHAEVLRNRANFLTIEEANDEKKD